MSGTKVVDNKVKIQEDTIIFPSGNKIITNAATADLGTTIRDMTLIPGDMVITNEGTVNILKANNTFTDITASGGSSGVVKTKYTFDHTDFTSLPGNSTELALFNLPAKAILTEVVVHLTSQFLNATGDSTLAQVGIVGDAGKFVPGIDLSGAPASGLTFERQVSHFLENMSSSTAIVLTVDSSGGTGDLSDLTAGTFDVYIEYKLLAD